MRILSSLLLLALPLSLHAQQPQGAGGGNDTFWQVTVNTMPTALRQRINDAAYDMQRQGGGDKSFVGGLLKTLGFSTVSSLIDVMTTETVNLVKYRKQQKNKWMQMIRNESAYTDSITAVKGLKDFYYAPSTVGALDPSNINFDGISIRGMREGREMLYLSCHIDTTQLDHLFRHSKFCLVVDTLAFHPLSLPFAQPASQRHSHRATGPPRRTASGQPPHPIFLRRSDIGPEAEPKRKETQETGGTRQFLPFQRTPESERGNGHHARILMGQRGRDGAAERAVGTFPAQHQCARRTGALHLFASSPGGEPPQRTVGRHSLRQH